jgi:hypothetical protein
VAAVTVGSASAAPASAAPASAVSVSRGRRGSAQASTKSAAAIPSWISRLWLMAADLAEIERYFAGVHAFYDPLPPDRYPVLAAIAPEMTGPDGDDRFEFGLTALIAGLEAISAAEKAGQ